MADIDRLVAQGSLAELRAALSRRAVSAIILGKTKCTGKAGVPVLAIPGRNTIGRAVRHHACRPAGR